MRFIGRETRLKDYNFQSPFNLPKTKAYLVNFSIFFLRKT